jgi:hypothetical protein
MTSNILFKSYMCVGDVSGELVYVNYGRVEDIEELQRLQVNLTGKAAMEDIERMQKLEVYLTGKGKMEDFAGCRKWRSQPQE